MNLKEQFLTYIKHEKADWYGYAFEAFPPFFPLVIDPITRLDADFTGESYIDHWGATWRHTENDPGAIPLVTQENKVIKDLENWRNYIKLPSLDGLDWSEAKAQIAAVDRSKTLVMIPSFYGPFERAHCLMPFEDVLIAMYTDPDIMFDLFGTLTDWKIEALSRVIDELHPDIIHSHDDWGDRNNLFFSPEVFRSLLKPHYKRLYDFIKSRGVLIQHHNDGVGKGLETDMLDLGIDMWQGVIPQNDIPKLQKNIGGKMLLLGGIDQTKFDFPDADESLIRAEVRRAIEEYAPGGSFLPCIASLVSINPEVQTIAIDEMRNYGKLWFEKHR